MKFSIFFAASLASATGVVPSFPHSDGLASAKNLTRDEAHTNILKHHPAEWIIDSKDIEEYLLANRGSNHTIYLSDEKAFVSMAKVEYDVRTHHTRESGPCIVPAKYTKTYTKQTGQWYGSWSPASPCQNGLKGSGGSSSISYSSSISISENAGLDWTIIKDVLSASLGLTVTESWTQSSTYSCTLPVKNVVQIWSQPYLAWGWFWSQTCVSNPMCGGCAPERVDGGATAPAKSPNTHFFFQIGCSTGSNNVRC